jgi:serine/threonine protein kinase
MYNTYRIGIVCEFIEHRQNLEYVFRKRKQMNLYWKQDEIEKMLFSLITTLANMQSLGLCHRDLKPANLF